MFLPEQQVFQSLHPQILRKSLAHPAHPHKPLALLTLTQAEEHSRGGVGSNRAHLCVQVPVGVQITRVEVVGRVIEVDVVQGVGEEGECSDLSRTTASPDLLGPWALSWATHPPGPLPTAPCPVPLPPTPIPCNAHATAQHRATHPYTNSHHATTPRTSIVVNCPDGASEKSSWYTTTKATLEGKGAHTHSTDPTHMHSVGIDITRGMSQPPVS